MFDETQLDDTTRSVLRRHGFETIPFEQLRERLKREGVDPARNRVRGVVEPLPNDLLRTLPRGGPERQAMMARGRAAIDAGHVGAVVLNGGMATRFGGTAKGVAKAFEGRSFLDLKLDQIARSGGGRVTAFLMNSFATDALTKSHVAALSLDLDIRHFTQMVALRVTREGEVFRDADGRPSLYSPGHGDLPYALMRTGELQWFREHGGRYLTVSNVDNLAAGLDPLIIGAHLAEGNPVTVELVATRFGDVGGFPALVNGHPEVVEAFRAPELFDLSAISRFNTNSFVFDIDALDIDFDLDWFYVEKKVAGVSVIQFERLVGQLTERFGATWLEVPRDGPESRFVPIKEPLDLERKAGSLRSVLVAQGVC